MELCGVGAMWLYSENEKIMSELILKDPDFPHWDSSLKQITVPDGIRRVTGIFLFHTETEFTQQESLFHVLPVPEAGCVDQAQQSS